MRIFILLFLMINAAAISQIKNHNVKFIVRAPLLKENSQIYITGNDSLLGNWNPAAAPLIKEDDSTWTITFQFAEGTNLEYKFTRGSWTNEAVEADGKISGNSKFTVQKDTTIFRVILTWKDNFNSNKDGRITGRAEYIKNLKGEGIKARDIVVWLPPEYDKNSAERYPVLYMHDGQNILDPATSAFGNEWRMDETADSLIKANSINPIIIVGIYNTPDRSREYSYGEEGDDYMNFIIHKLKPLIDKKYRTLSDRLNTATGGSSLGGLISLVLAWQHPDVFSKAICISPAFHIEDYDYVSIIKSYTGRKKNLKIYIDNGEEGLESRLQPGVNEMIAVLKDKDYKMGKDLLFIKDKNGSHSEASWATRIWRPLIFMFGK